MKERNRLDLLLGDARERGPYALEEQGFAQRCDTNCLCHEFTGSPLDIPELFQNPAFRILGNLLGFGLTKLGVWGRSQIARGIVPISIVSI
jgi:hypothetical protein